MYKIYEKGNLIKSFADRKAALAYREMCNRWDWDVVETPNVCLSSWKKDEVLTPLTY